MKTFRFLFASISFFLIALVFIQCQKEELVVEDDATLVNVTNKPATVLPMNNLSFPVIWADGYAIDLRSPGTISMEPVLKGEWWYVWGVDPDDRTDPFCSCKPNKVHVNLCEDGSMPGDGTHTVYKAYLQKRFDNIWQAKNTKPETTPYFVDLLDWNDNLEAVDWNTNSVVPTELILYDDTDIPMLQYAMKHVYGWGADEMYGLQTTMEDEAVFGPGNLATIYSHNIRFTIQKLKVDKDDIAPGSLTWVPNEGWVETNREDDLISPPIMNQAINEASSGPGYFNVEVNMEGKVVYRYNWNVRELNQGTGDYRITYSFDETGIDDVPLNTYFNESTRIIPPYDDGYLPYTGPGGEAKLDIENNLTFMDVHIR